MVFRLPPHRAPDWLPEIRRIAEGKGRLPSSWPPDKVVAALDGTPSSDAVIAWSAEFARSFGSSVTAVAAGAGRGQVAATVFEESDPEPRRTLTDAIATFARQSVQAKAVELPGSPAPALREFWAASRPALIVLGSHGHKTHVPASGVLRAIKNHVHCHIMKARGEVDRTAILVAYDGSTESQAAVAVAWGLARTWGARLDIIQVTAPASDGHEGSFVFEGRSVSCRDIPGGSPATVLALAQREGRHGLVVLGGTGRGGAPSWSLGSVSDQLTHEAACSVLVIRGTQGVASR